MCLEIINDIFLGLCVHIGMTIMCISYNLKVMRLYW
jgi:hypothetical protein